MNLAFANLAGANLQSANLSGSILTGTNLIRIQGSRHEINAVGNIVQIGCKLFSLDKWLENYEKIGVGEGYTPAEIKEYGMHLRHLQNLLDAGIIFPENFFRFKME